MKILKSHTPKYQHQDNFSKSMNDNSIKKVNLVYNKN